MGEIEKSEQIFKEFLERRKAGEEVTLEDYFQRYPDLKEEYINSSRT